MANDVQKAPTLAPEAYRTIAQSARCKVQVGACRFFGSAEQVQSEAEVAAFLEQVQSEHPEVKSHQWAYRFGVGALAQARYNDGGEPFQSAGPPIMKAIDHLQLTNTMVVVSRYFGQRQGIGGLIRAFHQTATTVLESAGLQTIELLITISASCRYEQLSYILQELGKAEAQNITQEYAEGVTLVAQLRPRNLQALNGRVLEWTKGSVCFVANEPCL